MVNSRYHRFAATPVSSRSEFLHQQGHTISRSYGVNLPSSLTWVLSSALVFSTHPPESVWGTVTSASIQSQLFLEVWDESLQSYGHDITSQPIVPRFYPTKRPTCLNRDNHRPADLPYSVPAIAPQWWYGNIDPFPIGFAFRLYLRGRLTLPG